MTFYETMVVPSMSYEGESWIINEVKKAADIMRLPSTVKGRRRTDRFRNSDIREKVNIISIG